MSNTVKTAKSRTAGAEISAGEAVNPVVPAVLTPQITPRTAPAPIPDEDKVELVIPRGSDREEQNLFISVNGVNYLLPRGKKSLVPKAVAREYERHIRALDGFDATRSALESK